MFNSNTTSEYTILERPPISPLLMDRTRWKYSNNGNNNNNIELAPNCPRCASSNTKFCYYNNYSLSQPRYFCKACRRYWTKGGSLRNVPVGGGCRKSRRARAAASRKGSAGYTGPTHSTAGPAGSANECADIDLAAVFARYVNPNVDDDNKESFSPGASSGSSENFPTSSLDSQLEDTMMFEYQKPVDSINGGDHDQMLADQFNGQDFVYQDCDVFELQQSILGDELAADVLWSSEGTNLPNIGSQNESTVRIEDFGLFSPDDQDQLSESANLVTDNWGSFDLSAYELYSRP